MTTTGGILTVSAAGNTFTVTRTDSTKAETYYYRTVDESAVARTHYTAAAGTLSFPAGTTTRTVTVSETTSANASLIDFYQNADRKYRFEVLGREDNAATTVSVERTVGYGSSYNVSSTYYGTEYAKSIPYKKSGDTHIQVTDSGFAQYVHTISTDDFFTASGTNAKTYFDLTDAGLYTRLTFQAREIDDGYQYVQILADDSSNTDGGAKDGDPGTINYSLYMAGMSIAGKGSSTWYKYAFPVTNAANGCSRITDAWGSDSYYNLGNTAGDLVTQKFKSDSYRSSDGTYLVIPITTSTVNTLNYRFNASGGSDDDWRLNSQTAYMKLSDTTAPTVTGITAPQGTWYSGDSTTLSVKFSEIVNVSGTPTLTTDIGTFTYKGGSGTNVLYFGGNASATSAKTSVKVTKVSGTIKDLAGNAYATSTSLSKTASMTVKTGAPSGSGTASSPYQITNQHELYWFADCVNGGKTSVCAKLANDIVVNPGTINSGGEYAARFGESVQEWTRIGYGNNQYAGTFNGNGKKISGLYKSASSADCQGLIGILSGGTLSDITIADSYIKGNEDVGAVCGLAKSGTISGCSVESSYIYGSDCVGGIVGYGYGTLSKCTNSGSVSGSSNNVGGILGYGAAELSECTNSGSVSGTKYVGGIVGQGKGSTVTNCINTCSVSGSEYVGGIIGYNNGTVKSSYDTAQGSIAGGNSGTIELCVYIADSAADNPNGTFARTSDQFASGAVTYLLNNGVTSGDQEWYQNIDNGETVDSNPILDSSHGTVYESHSAGIDGTVTYTYTNSRGDIEHVYDENGFCADPNCGAYEPAILAGDTYEIGNAGQLLWFSAKVRGDATHATDLTGASAAPSVKGKLMEDIDLAAAASGTTWTPIGSTESPYTGTFDGNGCSVTIGTTDSTADYQGLFGVVGDGSAISDVTVKGTVSGANYVAGVVGGSSGTGIVTISRCGNEAAVTASGASAAGIFGCNVGTEATVTIENCYNTGAITGGSDSAALSGGLGTGAAVTNCYNSGSVSGADEGYSFARYTDTVTFTNCYQPSTVGTQTGIDTTTAKDISSGVLAHTLQSNITDGTQVWGQTLGDNTDTHPILSASETEKVVKVTFAEKDGTEIETVYTNSGKTVTPPSGSLWWSSTQDTYTEFDYKTEVTEDTTVYKFDAAELPTPEKDDSGVYILDSVEDLYWFAGTVNGGSTTCSAKLGCDISVNDGTFDSDGTYTAAGDETAKIWTPIGTSDNLYTGTFDGAGYTVSGLYTTDGDYNGLFGYIGESGTVKFTAVAASYIGGTSTGAIAGNNAGTVSFCESLGTIYGLAGGIVGTNSGTVENSISLAAASIYGTGTVTVTASVYLAETAADNADGTYARTADDFAAGEPTYIANGENSATPGWYQNVDSGKPDEYPTYDDTHGTVYESHSGGADADVTYTNDNSDYNIHCYSGNGICEVCGAYEPALLADGTYEIGNAGQLMWFASKVNSGELSGSIAACLTADIFFGDMTGIPIGTEEHPFSGTFDGMGHSVDVDYNGLENGNYLGLFGYVSTAVIKNVVVKSLIHSTKYAAGIVGYASGDVTISGCGDEIGFYGDAEACAGIVGYGAASVTISDCYNVGTSELSTGTYYGIAGGAQSGTITNCYNNTSSTFAAGGATYATCYQLGDVGSSTDGIINMTEDAFTSGEVAYLLQSGVTDTDSDDNKIQVWGQSVTSAVGDTDASPVLTSDENKRVLKVDFVSADGNTVHATNYVNTGATVTPPEVDGVKYWSTNKATYEEFTDETPVTADTTVYAFGAANLPTPTEETIDGKMYYILDSLSDLHWFEASVNDGNTKINAKLGADIAVNPGKFDSDGTYTPSENESPETWTPIGTSDAPYAGTFDGAGYKVSGLYISTSSHIQGLFGYVEGGTIKDVTISNSYIDGGAKTGAVCGYLASGTITDCTNTGAVIGSGQGVGGIIGILDVGTISGCTNTGAVTGNLIDVGGIDVGRIDVGGIVGILDIGTISGCTNMGAVSGFSLVGGITGYNNAGTVTNCKNSGAISGDSPVGGIAGNNVYGKISYSMNVGTVTATDENAVSYDICGANYADGTVEACYYLVTGDDAVDVDNEDTTNNVYTYGRVKVRFTSGEIAYCLNNGESDGNQAWYQNIDNNETADDYPVLDSTHGTVYETHISGGTTATYTNDENKVTHSYDANGFCTVTNCATPYEPAMEMGSTSYQIFNAGQLMWFAAKVNGDTSVDSSFTTPESSITGFIGSNIVIDDSHKWKPIGKSKETPFKGMLYGAKCSVTINTTDTGSTCQGLVGVAGDGAQIFDITVKGTITVAADSEDSPAYAAGIVGYVAENASVTVTRCGNEAEIVAGGSYGSTAGIVGYNAGGTVNVSNCYSTGKITSEGSAYVIGDFSGAGGRAAVTNCYGYSGTYDAKVGFDSFGTVTHTYCYTCYSAENGKEGFTYVEEDKVTSGWLTHTLNSNGLTSAWKQTLGDGGDAHPVLTYSRVVRKVTFFTNVDGTWTENTAVYVNDGGTVAALPEVDGVAGWYTESVGGEEFDTTTAVTKDISVYGLTQSEIPPADGAGTAVNPYIITTVDELYWLANAVNGGSTGLCARLGNDITVNPGTFDEDGSYTAADNETARTWTPIGSGSNIYTGTFDGKGYKISGLYIPKPENISNLEDPTGITSYQGLFGYSSGTVKDVTVSGSYMCATGIIGAICGYSSDGGSFTGCTVENSYVTGIMGVGGILGYANDVTVTDCSNSGTAVVGIGSGSDVDKVSYNSYIGGIVGNVQSGSFTGCTNSGAVSGAMGVGGIAGTESGTFEQCENSGEVSGTSVVGGIAGRGRYFLNCKNTGAVSGETYVGGIAGDASYEIKSCVNIVTVSGTASDTSTVGDIYGEKGDEAAAALCFYLADGDTDNSDGTYAREESRFKTGEITYELNNGESDGDQAWYQTLDTDTYPMLDSTRGTVYKKKHAGSTEAQYTNDPTEAHNYDSYGICTTCGSYMPAFAVTYNGEKWYEIGNAGQLLWFSSLVNGDSTKAEDITGADTDAKGQLTSNIDMEDNSLPSWTPIGNTASKYTGTFNGDGYYVKITNTNRANSNMGLFGVVGDGADIRNVTVAGHIRGYQNVGGLIGCISVADSKTVTISGCGNNAEVDVTSGYVGGIVGRILREGDDTVSANINISNCYNAGPISSDQSRAGAIVGYNNSGGTAYITNCYNYGTITIGVVDSCKFSAGSTCTNCYQLDSVAVDSPEGVTTVTEAQVTGGYLAWTLNNNISGSDSTIWFQTLGNINNEEEDCDLFPVLKRGSEKVLKVAYYTKVDGGYTELTTGSQYTNPGMTVTPPEIVGMIWSSTSDKYTKFDSDTAITADTDVYALDSILSVGEKVSHLVNEYEGDPASWWKITLNGDSENSTSISVFKVDVVLTDGTTKSVTADGTDNSGTTITGSADITVYVVVDKAVDDIKEVTVTVQ